MRHRRDGTSQRHAWVVYRAEGQRILFDGVEGSVSRMLRPLPDVMAEYELRWV